MPAPNMPDAPSRHFGDTRTRSIWLWQLVLAISVVAIAAVTALLNAESFTDARFAGGLVLTIIVTLVTLAVPWHRARARTVLVIPTLDIFAIGILDSGSASPLVYLWTFPIAWVAAHYPPRILIGALALLAALALFGLFIAGLSVQRSVDLLVLLIVLGFIGTTMSTSAHRNRASKRLLRAQSARISSALERVTEQRARTRRLIDSLDIGIARVGSDGLLEVANRTFHELYALDDATQFSPARAVEYRCRRGDTVPREETTLQRAVRGELFADELVWLFGLDGQWRALNASTRVIDDGHYANDGVLLLVEDVTETVDPHARHGATMRTISHELRNPLTAVLGHVDLLLERDDLSDSARRQATIIQRAGDRMQALIDHALSEAGPGNEDHDVDFDLTRVAASAVEAFWPTAHAKGISVEADLDEPLPLSGDAFRVRQVVDNVLSNAIKYAQRGGRVSVRGYRVAPAAVALDVADTGIGIAPEDLTRVFEPDFRTSLARSSGIPGTGLGLGISRDIVLQQGGALDLRSELGHGTTVTITLPLDSGRSPA